MFHLQGSNLSQAGSLLAVKGPRKNELLISPQSVLGPFILPSPWLCSIVEGLGTEWVVRRLNSPFVAVGDLSGQR